MMKIAGETLSGRMDRVSMDIQNRMDELDDQLRNVVSRQYDVRKRENAWKAGPLLLAMNSKVQGSHDEPATGSAASTDQNYVQAEVRARSIGAISEGRLRQQSRSRDAEAELIADAQDRATVSRGRDIDIRIGAAQRIASRDRSVDSQASGTNSTSFVLCGTQPSEDGCSVAGSSAK